ncbi:arginine N-succinyltransferase [Sphingomonas sp.]|uniref:arginine N-succinyltransferase n=1 Tax=Sphingomonas sp. TaxID=28214 RepID=UPI00286E1F6E|nr:arginine N-succinyltransferase [Sphingomonas sp.]
MSFRVRAARRDDADAMFEMAKLTGGGFTNLPADRDTLVAKLERSDASFARAGDDQQADLYVFVLEDPAQGIIRGTCQVFGKVGVKQPFYSYHLSTLTQTSPELGKTFRNQMLSLTTDLEGSSEVGGLFLHPDSRSGGLGTLLARSRYLFIRQHRARFGETTLAELRGVLDEDGNSPFWDALAGRFFDMSFPEADQFNAIHGTRFIADLMPRTPIYVSLLADSARAVIGLPHPTGKGALRMLEEEGFEFDRYVDIFDGGPTVIAATDDIRSVGGAVARTVAEIGDGGEEKMLVSRGRLKDFAACFATVRQVGDGLVIDAATAALLGAQVGDELLTVGR